MDNYWIDFEDYRLHLISYYAKYLYEKTGNNDLNVLYLELNNKKYLTIDDIKGTTLGLLILKYLNDGIIKSDDGDGMGAADLADIQMLLEDI